MVQDHRAHHKFALGGRKVVLGCNSHHQIMVELQLETGFDFKCSVQVFYNDQITHMVYVKEYYTFHCFYVLHIHYLVSLIITKYIYVHKH